MENIVVCVRRSGILPRYAHLLPSSCDREEYVALARTIINRSFMDEIHILSCYPPLPGSSVIVHGTGVQLLAKLVKSGHVFGWIIVIAPELEAGQHWADISKEIESKCTRLEVFVMMPDTFELYEANIDGEASIIDAGNPIHTLMDPDSKVFDNVVTRVVEFFGVE